MGWTPAKLPDLIGHDGIFVDGDWIETKDQDSGGDVRLVQLADIGDGVFRDRSRRFLTSIKAAELNCTFLQRGDVLIARMPDPLGRACIFPGDSKKSVTAVDVCIVRPGAGSVDSRWLMWMINAPQARRAIIEMQSGTTRGRISRKNLCRISLPVPPVAEQRRIVAAIEEQFSRIDAGIGALRRAKRNLQRMGAALLQAALTGYLVRQSPEDEPAEALLKRLLDQRPGTQGGRSSGAQLSKVLAPPGDEPMPQGWSWVNLEMVAVTSSGGTPKRDRSEYFGGSIPWVKSGELRDGLVRETAECLTDKGLANSSARIAPRGTLMIALYGATVGKLGILDMEQAATNQAVCTIQPVIPEMRDYLWWVLRHRRTDLIFQGRGGAQPNISQEILRKLAFPLPPLAEQQRIVEQVERHWSILRDVDAAIGVSVHRSERLRRAVLSRAFQGRLVPQDPSDEPAATLLECIGVARTANDAKQQHRLRRPGR